MPKIFYHDKDNLRVYVKEVDYANMKIKFTKKEEDAEVFRGGYYGPPMIQFFRTNFKEAYPQVMDFKLDYGDDC